MNIPTNEIIKQCTNKKEIGLLLNQAEKAFITWETIWSNFIEAPIREEFLEKVKILNDIQCYSDGGYENAERHRICFTRASQGITFQEEKTPIKGLNIEGNFLFEKAEKDDFLKALNDLGACSLDIGDIWLMGDRGAQAICTQEISLKISGKIGIARNVKIFCEVLEIDQLNFPTRKKSKKIKSVESSKRLDAIASAGFGLSRGKTVDQIKIGKVRINWKTIKQASRILEKGDRIQIEDKGMIEILSLEKTTRGRWRVELQRE